MSTYNFNVKMEVKKFPALKVEDEYRLISLLISESILILWD